MWVFLPTKRSLKASRLWQKESACPSLFTRPPATFLTNSVGCALKYPIPNISSPLSLDKPVRRLEEPEGPPPEPVQMRRLATSRPRLARVLHYPGFEYLAPEVSPVQGDPENRLVDVLQFGQRELLGQQLEAERRVPELALQPSHGVVQDLTMIKGNPPRQPAHGLPSQISTVILPHPVRPDHSHVRNRYDLTPRVPPRRRDFSALIDHGRTVERCQLLHPGPLDTRRPLQHLPRQLVHRLSRMPELPRQSPEPLVRRVRPPAHHHRELTLYQPEYHQVHSNPCLASLCHYDSYIIIKLIISQERNSL